LLEPVLEKEISELQKLEKSQSSSILREIDLCEFYGLRDEFFPVNLFKLLTARGFIKSLCIRELEIPRVFANGWISVGPGAGIGTGGRFLNFLVRVEICCTESETMEQVFFLTLRFESIKELVVV
jgi:hypothetical protein